MMEVIKNAWLGWQKYTEQGKMAALLLLALLLFWFGNKSLGGEKPGSKEAEGSSRLLIFYTTAMTVCCICPLTAAALMTYQTRFYDYQWIWGAVPVTIVLALAGTQLWTAFAEKYAKGKGAGWKLAGITALLICVIYLCGRMQSNIWDADEAAKNREETARVLEILTENGQNKDICLWAPQGIMEYARALDGSIVLPYGRNMWDGALNAYSYDTYGEEEKLLYAWMCHAEATGEGEAEYEPSMAAEGTAHGMEALAGADALGQTAETRRITAAECMESARQLGVTHIVLPGSLQAEVLAEIEAYLGIQAEDMAGYYLLRIG